MRVALFAIPWNPFLHYSQGTFGTRSGLAEPSNHKHGRSLSRTSSISTCGLAAASSHKLSVEKRATFSAGLVSVLPFPWIVCGSMRSPPLYSGSQQSRAIPSLRPRCPSMVQAQSPPCSRPRARRRSIARISAAINTHATTRPITISHGYCENSTLNRVYQGIDPT